ncbi:ornithine cyclodeaminase family protein [Paraburkholderia gardini]|uniref:NAD(P)H-dependent anabolic L-arginine dehydrogenase DauB n=1 Tax=Paraburkholderia gardini TaxID=2823469 RepID=A0ABM8U7Z6_9BURK|nr:ornithine cyclodeaminase family protein [Paraburkholderia gardini]CAG4889809.1 NAD(P)H-dependent anabolic L-arginine dehydrogenase DauB [Paraburkholderia gardini]CAG4914071.1 NAD(P)H-dependent anabolic L-arginine dehydrogenase DauB [Paraburkholderia gardini]
MSRNEQAMPLIVDEDIVRRALPALDVQGALAAMFRALGEDNAVQPPQTLTLFPAQSGDFITYLGAMAQAKVFGAKLSPYIVTGGRPVVTAWTALMSMETGQPLMWCDAGLLTTERTAGTTALAVGHLAAAGARQLAIVGSGAIAQAHLRHVAPLRPWESIRVFSPDLPRDTAKQATLRAIDARATFSANVEDCVRDADVVMLCTSSGTSVLPKGALTRPALVTSISTNVANAHEIDPAWLPDMDVYCDYRRTTPGSAGEMKLAAERHGWSAQRVAGDLPELLCGTCPVPAYEKPVFFRSIGLGLEDVAIAYGLLQHLRALRDA